MDTYILFLDYYPLMATIVNTPAATHDHYVEDRPASSTGPLMTALLVILVIIALLYFVSPILRGVSQGPSINVPKQVDVNVNTPQNGGGAPQQGH